MLFIQYLLNTENISTLTIIVDFIKMKIICLWNDLMNKIKKVSTKNKKNNRKLYFHLRLVSKLMQASRSLIKEYVAN